MTALKKVIIIVCIVLGPLMYGGHTVHAQTTNSQPNAAPPAFNVQLPNFKPGTATVQPITVGANANKLSRYSIPWIANYINWIYQAMMAAGVIFAVLMIVFGGVQYIMAGSGGGIGQAKGTIKNAFTGLTLLIMTYTILAFINPAWTNLGFLSIVMPQLEEQPQSKPCDTTGFSNYFTHKDQKKYCTQEKNLVTLDQKNYGSLQIQGGVKVNKDLEAQLLRLNSIVIPKYLGKKKNNKDLFKDLKIQVTAGIKDASTQTSTCNRADTCRQDKNAICPIPQKATCSSGTNPALFGKSISVRLVGSGPAYEITKTQQASGANYVGQVNYDKIAKFECGTANNLCVPDLHSISNLGKECTKAVSCQYWLGEMMKEAGFKPAPARTWWEFTY